VKADLRRSKRAKAVNLMLRRLPAISYYQSQKSVHMMIPPEQLTPKQVGKAGMIIAGGSRVLKHLCMNT